MSLDALVSYLSVKKGTINGKKAFQKYMYFLNASGVPTPLNFRIHHFGPYSAELDYQTDNLELVGAIDISANRNGFVISPGKKALRIIEHDQDFITKYQTLIDHILNLLPNEPRVLELWSTVHFVANSMNQYYGGAKKENVIKEVKRIKQDKFTENEISEAFDKLIEIIRMSARHQTY